MNATRDATTAKNAFAFPITTLQLQSAQLLLSAAKTQQNQGVRLLSCAQRYPVQLFHRVLVYARSKSQTLSWWPATPDRQRCVCSSLP